MSRPVQGQAAKQVVLLPDAGPLITLAYADALNLLFRPGWAVQLVDMVWHEVTRADTPSRRRLAAWASAAHLKPARRAPSSTINIKSPPPHRAERSGKPASVSWPFKK